MILLYLILYFIGLDYVVISIGQKRTRNQPSPYLGRAIWNINGWTENNCILHKSVVYNLDIDILCVSETHLKQ